MMNRKLAASVSLVLLAGSPALMHAEDCCMPEYTPGEPLCDPCVGYTQYAGVQLNCGWDIYALGEFLYWRPLGSLTWVAEVIPQNVFTEPQTALTFRRGYRPGFRVGLGMVAHCFDDWIFNVDYLRYHHSFHHTFRETLPNSLTSIVFVFPGLLASSVKNVYHYHYDIVGLNLQRPNYLGQRVILSPFLGLKWLKRDVFFSQDLLDLFGGLNRARSTLKYTSIGISAGFDGSWLLCWGLSLIGNADVALLYAYERSFLQVVNPAIPDAQFNPNVTTKQHIRHLDVYAKGGMGLSWGSYFCCERYHVNLSATFDFMGDVVRMDNLTPMQSNASVVLMGLSVCGKFDF